MHSRRLWTAISGDRQCMPFSQPESPVETIKPDETVQIAAVYEGNRITLYCRGRVYSSYKLSLQLIWMIIIMPETKGISLEQLQKKLIKQVQRETLNKANYGKKQSDKQIDMEMIR